jgi:hypothetical protein
MNILLSFFFYVVVETALLVLSLVGSLLFPSTILDMSHRSRPFWVKRHGLELFKFSLYLFGELGIFSHWLQ